MQSFGGTNPVDLSVCERLPNKCRSRFKRLGHLGDGIGDGPVYAPRTLPGEVVEGELNGTRMAAPRIVTPSPNRVSPPCRHYKGCGSCAVQHADDGFVKEWKVDIVRTAPLCSWPVGADPADAYLATRIKKARDVYWSPNEVGRHCRFSYAHERCVA